MAVLDRGARSATSGPVDVNGGQPTIDAAIDAYAERIEHVQIADHLVAVVSPAAAPWTWTAT